MAVYYKGNVACSPPTIVAAADWKMFSESPGHGEIFKIKKWLLPML
jgi:hypothetical protein